MLINKDEKKSIRSVYGKTLAELGKTHPEIVVMDADLACSTQSQIFAKEFPNRFFDCGIAEQDMIATATGLASCGKTVFASTFAMFATGRTYDQIRNSVCYPKFNVKVVGTHGGITVGEDGASHQALEDISLMRSIPNMSVLVPADCRECEQIVKYAVEHKGPMYIRLPRTNVCDIFDENYKFDFNKVNVIQKGTDINIFTNGEMLVNVIEASGILQKEGYSVGIINVPVVKPIDKHSIIEIAKSSNLIVTVENHSIIGGLGSAVCETIAENYPKKVLRIGVNDEFGQSGDPKSLLDFYGLSAEKIASRIKNEIKNNKESL